MQSDASGNLSDLFLTHEVTIISILTDALLLIASYFNKAVMVESSDLTSLLPSFGPYCQKCLCFRVLSITGPQAEPFAISALL